MYVSPFNATRGVSYSRRVHVRRVTTPRRVVTDTEYAAPSHSLSDVRSRLSPRRYQTVLNLIKLDSASLSRLRPTWREVTET